MTRVVQATLSSASTKVRAGEITGKGSVNVKLEIESKSGTTIRTKNINLSDNKTYTFE